MTHPALSIPGTPAAPGLLRRLMRALAQARRPLRRPSAHDETLYARSLMARHGKLD